MVQKLHICEKVYFDQFFDFRILLFYYFTLYYCVIFYSLDARFFQYHPGVKKFGSRSGPTFCRALSGSKLFASLSADIVGKELNTKQLVDTLWIKPWLKVISFGSNFFHLA